MLLRLGLSKNGGHVAGNDNDRTTSPKSGDPTSDTNKNPLGIGYPWEPVFNISIRGAEYTHTYFWIVKDFAWTQGDEYLGMVVGTMAVIWCALLFYQAIAVRNVEEIYMLCGVFLWIYGNYWWMYGELVNNDDAINQPTSQHILEAGLLWVLLFHVLIQPLGIIKHNPTSPYVDTELTCRIPYFKSWRQYEHIHTFFWMGKDLSWNVGNPVTWIICTIPTLAIALDFIWVSLWHRGMTVELVHYVSLIMWVLGNLLWAYGEVFVNDNDDAIYVFNNPLAVHNSNTTITDDYMYHRAPYRWYASWVLFAAMWPVILLYAVWLPLTYFGLIDKPTRESIIARISMVSLDFENLIPDIRNSFTMSRDSFRSSMNSKIAAAKTTASVNASNTPSTNTIPKAEVALTKLYGAQITETAVVSPMAPVL